MKNKHLLALFLVAALSVWLWNRFLKQPASSSAADIVAEQVKAATLNASTFTLDDGTEPNIQLTHDQHGWRLQFGTMHAPADEDSVRLFLQTITDARLCALPAQPASGATVHLTTEKGTLWQLKSTQGDTLVIFEGNDQAPKAALVSKANSWLHKPWETWIFRKLQTLPVAAINDLTWEWRDFGGLNLQKPDTVWTLPAQLATQKQFFKDTLLVALTQLNQLEPALAYDPISEAARPFATLYVNQKDGAKLSCYRRTEHVAEYFLHSSHAPQVYFLLPPKVANVLFVRPMLDGLSKK